MAADLGCSMETIMAHYMSNHIAVAYGDIFGEMAALVAIARLQGSDPRAIAMKPPAAGPELGTDVDTERRFLDDFVRAPAFRSGVEC